MGDTLTPVEESGIVAKVTKKVERQKEKNSGKNKNTGSKKLDQNSKNSTDNRPGSTKVRSESGSRPQSGRQKGQDSKHTTNVQDARGKSSSRPASGTIPTGTRPTSGARPKSGTRPTSGTRSSSGARPTSGTRPKSGTRQTSDARPTSGARPKSGTRPTSGTRSSSGARPTSGTRPTSRTISSSSSTGNPITGSRNEQNTESKAAEQKTEDGTNPVLHVKSLENPNTTSIEKTEAESEQPQESQKPVVEKLGLGAKTSCYFSAAELKDPCRVRYTKEGHFVVLDREVGRVIQYNSLTGAKIREFRYLLNYHFQGGFAVTGEDTILVALKNDKFSSISFYKMEGKFKFSAFLDKDAEVSGISANSIDEIMSLNSSAKTVCILNREKRLDKSISLASENNGYNDASLTDIAANSNNDIIIADRKNNSVSCYDYTGKFIHKFSQRKEDDPFSSVQRVVVNSTDCMLVLDHTPDGGRIDLFDPEGNHIGCPVMITSGHIADFDCLGMDQIVALVSNNSLVTLRIYTFTVPRKFRKLPNKPRKVVDTKEKQTNRNVKNGHVISEKKDEKKADTQKAKNGEEKDDKKTMKDDKNNNKAQDQKSCCCIIL